MLAVSRCCALRVFLVVIWAGATPVAHGSETPQEPDATRVGPSNASRDEAGQDSLHVNQRIQNLEAELEALKRAVYGDHSSPDATAQDTHDDPGTGFEVQVGTGSLKISGLLQAWFKNGQIDEDEFLIRRAEIAFVGQVVETVGYTLMIDVGKEITDETGLLDGGGNTVPVLTPASDDKILQDAFLSFSMVPHHTIHFGQRLLPIGMEGLAPSGDLDFPERTILGGASVAGVRGYGDVRDIGIQVDGDWTDIHYSVGVYNGEGPNASEDNDRKDIAARVVVNPVPWLHLGASHYNGSIGEDEDTRDRTGAELAIQQDACFLKSEYGRGKDDDTRSDGWYVSGGYRFEGLSAFDIPFDVLAAIRYEEFDPDTDASGDEITAPTVGLSLLLDDHHAKVQLSYSHYALDGEDEDLVIAAFQAAF